MSKNPRRNLPQQQQQVQQQIVRAEQTQTLAAFSGPLPPPEILKQYDEVFAGCAERIVVMAERQSTHRQSLETTVIKGGSRNETLGLIGAAVLGITAIICGYLLVEHGKDAQGFSVILGTIGTLAGIFIWGRHRQEKERKEKLKRADH